MSWLSNLINHAGSRMVHIPDAELPSYVQEANFFFNPDSDPALPAITSQMWRACEKALVMGVQAHALDHALHQALPSALQPLASALADAAQPAPVQPVPPTVPNLPAPLVPLG